MSAASNTAKQVAVLLEGTKCLDVQAVDCARQAATNRGVGEPG
jgi:hypothetical protein